MWHSRGLSGPGGSVEDHDGQWTANTLSSHHHHHHHPLLSSSPGQWRQLSLAICHHELEQRQRLGSGQGSNLLLNDLCRWPEYSRLLQHHHCPFHHHHHHHCPPLGNRSWPHRGQINNSNQLHHHHQFYLNIPPSSIEAASLSNACRSTVALTVC